VKSIRRFLVDKLTEAEEAANALREAERSFKPGTAEVAAAQTRKNDADVALALARTTEQNDLDALTNEIANWLTDTAGGSPRSVTPAEDVARLDASAPVVMFPVRLETRFEGNLLRLRVYPDEILLNQHESALTQAEYDAGVKYYTQFFESGDELKQWREIIARFGPERSAYILRVMLPDPLKKSSCPLSLLPIFRGQVPVPPGFQAPLKFPSFGDFLLPSQTMQLQKRTAIWTRPVEAVLPDRWVAITYRNGVRKVFVGSPVVEPLAITVDPGHPTEQQSSISDNDYKVDNRIRWTVDFERAKAAGMGLDIPLQADEAAVGSGGFDRVIVLGVKSSMDKQETADHLLALLDAHHYTRGLAIVRQGSPTNNTADSPTPFPPQDENGEHSYQVERGLAPLHPTHSYHCAPNFGTAPCVPPESDGFALAAMLGVPNGIAETIDRGFEHEINDARAMNRVLWPATYGYFLKWIMNPTDASAPRIFSDSAIDRGRQYFTEFVRARGPAPAFRVGAVPYGVLPVTALKRWQVRDLGSADEKAVEAALLDPLKKLVEIWRDAAGGVKRVVPGSSNPDLQLASVLSTYASAREVRVRSVLGEVSIFNIFSYYGWDYFFTALTLLRMTRTLFDKIGFPDWLPRLGGMVLNERAWTAPLAFVVPPQELSEELPLTPNFISEILSASIPALLDDTLTSKQPVWLYLLLRHATLLELMLEADRLRPERWEESDLLGIFTTTTVEPITDTMRRLESTLRNTTNVRTFMTELRKLEQRPTAELERLLGEGMDLGSHRLDAWVTAFATRRITRMREQQVEVREGTFFRPYLSYLGGYAWLENLRPVARQLRTEPVVGSVEIQPHNGGFIHAPSMTHASAAAVLRNGHMSFKQQQPQKYAVDLSSRRVRSARGVLDEVRAGQQLGAVLGYRFERAIHERFVAGIGNPALAQLEKQRYALRSLFPLVAGKNGVDTSEPAEKVAARNVVDGVSMLRARRAGEIDFANNPALPKPGTQAFDAIKAELDALEETLDAVSDLLLSESVLQLARGNIAGASVSLDNLVLGKQPPDPAVAQSPRGGIGVSHKVAVVFPKNVADDLTGQLTGPGSNWPTLATPRAAAEPLLDAWLGRLIGDPAKVTCRVTFDEAPGRVEVKLSDLALRPLDVLALSRMDHDPGLASALNERVLAFAIGVSVKTNLVIDYAPPTERDADPERLDTERSFPEVLELARALGSLLGGARALAISDLLPPAELEAGGEESETGPGAPAPDDASELVERAKAARAELLKVTSSVDPADAPTLASALVLADPAQPTPTELQALRAALGRAASFAPERAVPPHDATGAELVEIATAVQGELRRRLDAFKITQIPPGPSEERLRSAAQAMKVFFGGEFFVMPVVTPPRATELEQSLDARSTLLSSNGAAADERAPDRYLQQAMRTRPGLSRYRKLLLYAGAFGADKQRADVLQLPFVPGEKWLGLEGAQPDEGRAALLLLSDATELDAHQTWQGIFLEHWTEIIPGKTQMTGVAFHYDTPRASAPQAALVVAPASTGSAWQFEDLVGALEETLDLAKIRGVDSELVPLGQLFPTTMLAQNPESITVTAPGFLDAIGAAVADAARGFVS